MPEICQSRARGLPGTVNETYKEIKRVWLLEPPICRSLHEYRNICHIGSYPGGHISIISWVRILNIVLSVVPEQRNFRLSKP